MALKWQPPEGFNVSFAFLRPNKFCCCKAETMPSLKIATEFVLIVFLGNKKMFYYSISSFANFSTFPGALVSIGEQCPPSNPVSVTPTSSNPSSDSSTSEPVPTCSNSSVGLVAEIECENTQGGDTFTFCDCDTPSATCILIKVNVTQYTNDMDSLC